MTSIESIIREHHADDDSLSLQEQALISLRADQIIVERIADPTYFADLMSGIEPTTYWPDLQRAVVNVMRSSLDRTTTVAITTAVYLIACIVQAEAESVWRDEAEALAQKEVIE